MKILLLDIETAPNVVHVWGLWNQNVGTPQIIASGYVMCWAAKWLGEDDVMFDSIFKSDAKTMLDRIHKLLEEADAVVHYNGTKFDIPTLNKEFVSHGLTPPAPYKQIDLLTVCRNEFRFPSNKLDFIAKQMGLGGKVGHEGHMLWVKCMDHDPVAWQEMEEYNKHDVILLEKVYKRILPWIKGHANHALYRDVATESEQVCPNCGGSHFQRRGYAYTADYKYPRFQCKDCKTWFRGAYRKKPDNEQRFKTIRT